MYLQRRDYSWYFRLPIPKALKAVYGKSEICFSLKTKSKREAQLKSLEHIHHYFIEFERKCAELGASPLSSAPLADTPAVKRVTFLQVYEKFLKERKATIGTEMEFEAVVKRFVGICGNADIALYTKSDILLFKDTLLQFPKYLTKEDLSLTPDKIVAKYANSPCLKMTATTIRNKYLALLKVLFNYALMNGFRADNPVATVKVLVPTKQEPARLPYSVSQVKEILCSTLFAEPQDRKHNEYRYVILLALFTGARMEELCRLKCADYGEENGIRYLFIQPDEEHGHTLKTTSSRRRVPLHSRLLLHYGFLGYLEEVKKEEYLFPVINAGQAVKGKISHSFSKWYGRYLSSIGLSDRRLTFHSFRHSFKAFGRTSGIEKSVLDAIQGHKGREVSLDYGKDEFGSVYALKTLSEALERIEAFRDL